MIVWDTNIVSEFMRTTPHANVFAWTQRQPLARVSAVTVEEVTRGIARLPLGRRQRELAAVWISLQSDRRLTVLPYGQTEAERCGLLLANGERIGRPLSHPDAQIAATCLVRGATLATRNTSDFDHIEGLELVNPFRAQ